jgi:hypothetical protein
VGDVVYLTLLGPGGQKRQDTVMVGVNGTYSWRLPSGVGGGWVARAVQPWTHRRTMMRLVSR